MIRILSKLFRFVAPIRKPIWVRFSVYGEWTPAESVNGIYHGHWWPVDDFPLRLNNDGTGTLLLKGVCGTGKPYPGFEWKLREEGRAK